MKQFLKELAVSLAGTILGVITALLLQKYILCNLQFIISF